MLEFEGRILRTVERRALADFEFVQVNAAFQRMVAEGRIVTSEVVEPRLSSHETGDAALIVEHPRLPLVTYPYEWCFAGLKRAALFHLDLQMDLLTEGIALSDASAYNVQFTGPRPVFIDVLSFRKYRDGEYWTAHRQFCEQFLNPLLLRAYLGVSHNAWYRGSLEGIGILEMDSLLPWHRKMSWRTFTHVALQARLQRKGVESPGGEADRIREQKLPRQSYLGMLSQLRDWIAGLEPRDRSRTVWSDYACNHSYASAEQEKKRQFVGEFATQTKPAMLWDLGCNSGDYSSVALTAGAGRAIGFDADQDALDQAFERAASERLDLLPLYQDAANPSPGQGWNGLERSGLQDRACADAVLALAFEHHLAIARNVPLAETLGWIAGLAPCGVVEFVPKSDPTVQQMLSLREDIFEDYDERHFVAMLSRHARIVRDETVSDTGRRLFWYDRR